MEGKASPENSGKGGRGLKKEKKKRKAAKRKRETKKKERRRMEKEKTKQLRKRKEGKQEERKVPLLHVEHPFQLYVDARRPCAVRLSNARVNCCHSLHIRQEHDQVKAILC